MSFLSTFNRSFPSTPQSAPQSTHNFEDLNRFSRYYEFYRLYLGNHWDKPRQDGENYVTANFCAKFVDKSAAFLTSKSWSIIDPDTGYAAITVPFLNQVWEDNIKDVLCYENAQTGGVCGDSFLLVDRTEDNRITITNQPPVFTTPVFHPTDKSRLLSGTIEFPFTDPVSQLKRTMTTKIDQEKMVYYIDGKYAYSKYHGLGECPLIHIRNRVIPGAAYGASDLAHLGDLQRNLNAKLTDLSDIVDYHTAPTVLGYGTRLIAFEKGARTAYGNLPLDSRIEYLHLNADLAASTNFVQFLVKLMHIMADVPQIALSDSEDLRLSNTSGLAIQLMFQSLLDLTALKRGTYGQGYKDVNRIALKYGVQMGIIQEPFSPIEKLKFYKTGIRFADPLPRDELILLNKIITRLKNGLLTVKDALESLGETNTEEYIKQILEDIEEGRNIVATGGTSNIGGIIRDQATVEQVQHNVDMEIEKSSVEEEDDA